MSEDNALAHDARCGVWASNDVEDCDCRDDQGHRPRTRLTDSPTLRAAIATQFPCDEDPDEASA